VHHVRTELSLAQLSKVVYLFSRNIHDASLPFNIQTMSAKLLLNLVRLHFRLLFVTLTPMSHIRLNV